MQTTMIRASMTAYSTAVGPLSSLMKLRTPAMNLDIRDPLSDWWYRADGYRPAKPRDPLPLIRWESRSPERNHRNAARCRFEDPNENGDPLPHPFGNLATRRI